MKYNLTNEIKAKFTSEQLVIAENWNVEREKRSKIMDQLEAGTISYTECIKQIDAITPEYCEHNRSIMGICIDCIEIENIINPNRNEEE